MLDKKEISQLDDFGMFDKKIFDELYDISDPLEHERIKALLLIRAAELGIENQFNRLLKKYDKELEKIQDLYAKTKAEHEDAIPIKRGAKGKVICSIENFLIIMRNDEKFNNLQFNLLSHSPERISGGKTERWADADDAAVREYIESKYNLHSKDKLDDALRIVFREREYHPIKQIIESVSWDGKERIPTLLIKWLKCEDTPYTREVSRLIFAGGINRLYNPGCKFDDVPVLIGTKQGEGKSTFVRWLALKDEFFTEVTEIEGQKGIEAIEGSWICEIAELLALTKAKEVEAVKSYITKQSDKYRRPFDKRTSEVKRQCIFIGTTNKEQFLTDKTGNRRFYPVKVRQSGYELFKNEKSIRREILQCWAEAKVKYEKNEMLPVADSAIMEEIKIHQQNAVEDDYRDGIIEAYLENRHMVCIIELWQKALGNETIKPTKRDSNEISLIMQRMSGWEKSKNAVRVSPYGVQKVWYKISDGDFYEAPNEKIPF